jgi:hypothetical protein
MVLLDGDQEHKIAASIAESAAKVRYTLPRELKFSKLAKNARGRRVLRDAMKAVQSVGATIFFSVTEKRYLAASFVVETFLDPLWTDGAPIAMMSPIERRKAANLIYQACDDRILTEFLVACRAADRDLIVATGERAARRLEIHPSEEGPELANAIMGGLRDPFDWSAPEGAPALSNRPTPHTFTFVPLLGIADRYLRELGQVAQLIADEDAQFGPFLAEAVRLGQCDELFPGGVGPYGTPGPLTHVGERTERRSDDELGIQIADLMAGMIGAASRADMNGENLRGLGEAWAVLRKSLLKAVPSAFWQVSERMLGTLSRSFEGLLPNRDDWHCSRL